MSGHPLGSLELGEAEEERCSASRLSGDGASFGPRSRVTCYFFGRDGADQVVAERLRPGASLDLHSAHWQGQIPSPHHVAAGMLWPMPEAAYSNVRTCRLRPIFVNLFQMMFKNPNFRIIRKGGSR